MLDRKAILGHKDTNFATVHVEEFGGVVNVALLSAAEADQIKTLGESEIPSNVGLVILAACDAKGTRLFQQDDAEALSALPSRALTKIATKILEHNGLLATAAEDAKNGSSETDSDGSASGSPSPSVEQ